MHLNFDNVERCRFSDIVEAASIATNSTCLSLCGCDCSSCLIATA